MLKILKTVVKISSVSFFVILMFVIYSADLSVLAQQPFGKSVDIHPENIETYVGADGTGMSALLYDVNEDPVWSGVEYEWGMSSSNSIGTINSNHNIATFVPQNRGIGDLYVIARFQGESAIGSIPVCVSESGVSVLPADLDSDYDVDIFDYNQLVTDFGWTGPQGGIPADIDQDGVVGIFDYNILVTDFGKTGC